MEIGFEKFDGWLVGEVRCFFYRNVRSTNRTVTHFDIQLC